VGWVREAAGPRFSDVELHTIVLGIKVTDDRRQGGEEIAAMLASMPPTIVSNVLDEEQTLDSPHILIGTVEQIVEDLQARRERYGISYVTVPGEYIDAFSPVVARLAGT
jgi:hypothetical protein